MTTRSIRFRLTVWYALTLAGGLALFGGLIWLSLRQRLTTELDEELNAGAGRFETYFRRESAEESGVQLKAEMEEFCQALPANTWLRLRGTRGFEFSYPPASHPTSGTARTVTRRFTLGSETFELETGASVRQIEHTLQLLGFLLVGLIPAVVAAACLGGVWMSGRALRPVDEITTAARSIGIENLSRRLAVPATGDEIERLTAVWNGMLERLEGAVGTLSQFAADASHELRTPLAVIRTSAELALRRARSPESYRESLEQIAAEAERMTQLVEDLLFLARSGTGVAAMPRHMPVERVDLRGVVRDVVTELRGLADVRNIRVLTESDGREAAVSGNRATLRRLLLVLVDNAIKYSHVSGDVRVSLRRSDTGVVAEVRDFGMGIPPADLPHIFQRFYRADKARSNGGHGLGLSLAKTIAEEHGATIAVTSEPGKGSVFEVRFPVRVCSDMTA